MDEVVAADGQSITVTSDDEDGQIRARHCHPRRDGRGTAVDGVHAIGVHVVREARGATDARDDNGVLLGDAQIRQHTLEGGQNRVVATAGAPAHLLVGGEVTTLQRLDRQWHTGKSGGTILGGDVSHLRPPRSRRCSTGTVPHTGRPGRSVARAPARSS